MAGPAAGDLGALVVVVSLILTSLSSRVFAAPLAAVGSAGAAISLVLLAPIVVRLRAVWHDTREGRVEEAEARLEQRRGLALVDVSGRRLRLGRGLAIALRGRAPGVYTAFACRHSRRVVAIVPRG